MARTILIGGDICPIGINSQAFVSGDAGLLFGDLLPALQQADLVLANLECPLIEEHTPIEKTGPIFGEPSACINGIKSGGIDLLCLANNHIMDHGAAGLANTIDVCTRAGLATVGAGKSFAIRRRIFIREIQNVRVGVLAMAEHEFSISTGDNPGAYGLDLIDFVRNVKEHKQNFNYLIVLLHGGDEFFVPSPRIKNTCRFLIESGANAVIVQHPHHLGGYEEYRGGHIVYGQGALVMDEALYRKVKSFHEGYLVKLLIGDDATSKMEIIPYTQSNPEPGMRLMRSTAEQVFRLSLEDKSRAIKDDAYVRSQWLQFCEENKHDYLSALLGHNKVIRKLNAKGHLSKLLYTKRVKLSSRNIISCETHREVIDTIFTHKLI